MHRRPYPSLRSRLVPSSQEEVSGVSPSRIRRTTAVLGRAGRGNSGGPSGGPIRAEACAIALGRPLLRDAELQRIEWNPVLPTDGGRADADVASLHHGSSNTQEAYRDVRRASRPSPRRRGGDLRRRARRAAPCHRRRERHRRSRRAGALPRSISDARRRAVPRVGGGHSGRHRGGAGRRADRQPPRHPALTDLHRQEQRLRRPVARG